MSPRFNEENLALDRKASSKQTQQDKKMDNNNNHNNNSPVGIIVITAIITMVGIPMILFSFDNEIGKTFFRNLLQNPTTRTQREIDQEEQQRRKIQELEAENEELKQRLHLSTKEIDLFSGKEQEVEGIADVKECDRVKLLLTQTIQKLEIRKVRDDAKILVYTNLIDFQEKLLLEEIESLKRSAKITKENEESKECRICLDNRCEIALFPCGHVCLCDACSRNGALVQCPICRAQITRRLKVFL